MNFLKSFVLVTLFFCGVSSSSFAGSYTSIPESIGKQIQTLLLPYGDDFSTSSHPEFKIDFLINSKSELVVLGTNAKEMDETLKSALNYKKVLVDTLEFDKVYTIPVKVKK